MSHVRVKAKVINDNTGSSVTIPAILVEQNGMAEPLQPLVDYFLTNYHSKSISWMDKVCQAVGMLLDYIATHAVNFTDPKDLFESFAQKVYSGTVGEDGSDPSGLYWLGKRTDNAKGLLNAVSDFSDWMHDKQGAKQLNPWREATTYEQRLKWAAFIIDTFENHDNR